MAKIPEKRHGKEELSELRMRNAFSVRPPVQAIKNQALRPVFLSLCYLICVVSVGLCYYQFTIPCLSCAGLGLLSALFIFWKKPRSRHHATLMIIISLLVLVFGSVYYFAQFEQPTNDPQGPIRY